MVTLSCAQNVLAKKSVKRRDIAIAARRGSAVLLLTLRAWIGPQHNMAAAAGDEMVLPVVKAGKYQPVLASCYRSEMA